MLRNASAKIGLCEVLLDLVPYEETLSTVDT